MQELANEIRKDLIKLHNRTHTSHIGSEFSSVDIMVELYYEIMKTDNSRADFIDSDYFILSKGHAAPALYDILYRRGFISKEVFDSYGVNGTILAEHPNIEVKGVVCATGSLGHGLPIGSGIAYSLMKMKKSQRVFVLLSDGECQEGSTIEAANFAGRMKLDNLVAIVDNNGLQGFERTSNIQKIEAVQAKFSSSNWSVAEIDGHDYSAMKKSFSRIPLETGKPSLFIANTVKGKGIKAMEDRLEWHYRSPSDTNVNEFIRELEVRR